MQFGGRDARSVDTDRRGNVCRVSISMKLACIVIHRPSISLGRLRKTPAMASGLRGVQSLGVPIRRMAAVAPASAAGTIKRESPARPEQYDVALSFAGENRTYVEQVAEGLKAAGVSVFYDKFEKADLWGKNLIEHLAEIYGHRSRFVVMFVSKEYVEKAWTTHASRVGLLGDVSIPLRSNSRTFRYSD